jgi:hypothetical protein
MHRTPQILLIAATLAASWLGMQAVHEAGHVVGAWLTGGRVERVVLHPLTISRTDLAVNPHPLVVSWTGPLLGAALPLLLWGLAAALRLPERFLARFFAGFCLLANGLYIGVGSFWRVGDGGDLVQHGAPLWTLWLFGLIAAPAGLGLWHALGPHFGLGASRGQVSHRAVIASLVAVAVLLVLGLAAGRGEASTRQSRLNESSESAGFAGRGSSAYGANAT